MRTAVRTLFLGAFLVLLPVSANAAGCDEYDVCLDGESAAVMECEGKAIGKTAIRACDDDIKHGCEKLDAGGCEDAYFKKKYGPKAGQ